MALSPDEIDLVLKLFLAGVFAFLIIGVAKHADTARKRDGSMKTENFQSLWAINIALFFIILYMVVNFDFSLGYEEESSGPTWLVPAFLIGTPAVLIVLYLVSNLVQAVIRGKPKQRRWGTEMAEYDDPDKKIKRRLDLQRKATHILIYFSMFLILAILNPFAAQYDDEQVFWGDRSGLNMLATLQSETPFAVAQGILVLFFYILSMVFLFIEVTRLSTWKYSHFPLHQTIQRTLRAKELDSVANYVHFSVGFLFASLFLPPTLLMAAFGLFSIGDTMAATIGINFGKHKIAFNRDKSWEGTVGGFAFSFISAVWFVGPWWALLASLLFVVIDLFSPEPILVADNILIPMATTGLFWLLAILGLPAVSLIF